MPLPWSLPSNTLLDTRSQEHSLDHALPHALALAVELALELKQKEVSAAVGVGGDKGVAPVAATRESDDARERISETKR